MPAWMIRVWRAPWLWAVLVIALFCVPLFIGLDRRVFTHERYLTANEWIEELETHSPVAMLEGVVRE